MATYPFMLGRKLHHDPQSRGFPAPRDTVTKSIMWRHSAPILDQGRRNSCTGNATAQLLNTCFHQPARPKRRYLVEQQALDIYGLATSLDPFEGRYPPDDTGSDGLSAAKAATRLFGLPGYDHAFGFDHFLSALQLAPGIVGTNWYESMFDADEKGVVKADGKVAGGHEYLALGVNYKTEMVTFVNSWGPSWPFSGARGRFKMSFTTFAALLDQDGDATFLRRKAA